MDMPPNGRFDETSVRNRNAAVPGSTDLEPTSGNGTQRNPGESGGESNPCSTPSRKRGLEGLTEGLILQVASRESQRIGPFGPHLRLGSKTASHASICSAVSRGAGFVSREDVVRGGRTSRFANSCAFSIDAPRCRARSPNDLSEVTTMKSRGVFESASRRRTRSSAERASLKRTRTR